MSSVAKMEPGRPAELRLASLATQVAFALADGLDWLTEHEQLRLSAMRSELRQRQFLAGHWLVRCLAAETLGGKPREWLLSADPDGVPRLSKSTYCAGQGVCASISHCGDWVVTAISPWPVGVDIECNSKRRDFLALAEHAFSPSECAALHDLAGEDKAAVFYQFWTLKEAVGKRDGHGMRPELARRQSPIACAQSEAEVMTWQLTDCSVALAGGIGMPVRVAGLPEGSSPNYWRIDSAATK
jgi:4'-phosphopantetheinyl transferase